VRIVSEGSAQSEGASQTLAQQSALPTTLAAALGVSATELTFVLAPMTVGPPTPPPSTPPPPPPPPPQPPPSSPPPSPSTTTPPTLPPARDVNAGGRGVGIGLIVGAAVGAVAAVVAVVCIAMRVCRLHGKGRKQSAETYVKGVPAPRPVPATARELGTSHHKVSEFV